MHSKVMNEKSGIRMSCGRCRDWASCKVEYPRVREAEGDEAGVGNEVGPKSNAPNAVKLDIKVRSIHRGLPLRDSVACRRWHRSP